MKDDKATRSVGRGLYPSMQLGDICNLSVKEITNKDCILFLWATMPCLEQAFQVIKSWGFIYKTVAFTWVKQNKKGWGYYSGLGNWTLANPELCLLATHKTFPKRKRAIKQLVLSPLREHSRKPDEVRDRIVELVGDLLRIELFAHQKVEGWDCWGNEVESDIEL